jgi:hypothetical protein
VLGGVIFYPLGSEVFRFYDEFSRTAPNNGLTSRFNPYSILSIRRGCATSCGLDHNHLR